MLIIFGGLRVNSYSVLIYHYLRYFTIIYGDQEHTLKHVIHYPCFFFLIYLGIIFCIGFWIIVNDSFCWNIWCWCLWRVFSELFCLFNWSKEGCKGVLVHIWFKRQQLIPKNGKINISLNLLNPFTTKISLVILLTVCHTILIMFILRTWCWIN